jgi:predicted AAA+ superfamily ATPase
MRRFPASWKWSSNMQARKRRTVVAQLRAAFRDRLAVVLVGPRQCGKTTWHAHSFRSLVDRRPRAIF